MQIARDDGPDRGALYVHVVWGLGIEGDVFVCEFGIAFEANKQFVLSDNKNLKVR